MRYAIILLLSGCATYPIPDDMVVTETHYSDPQKLIAKCMELTGKAAEACVVTNHTTSCDMHLPLAANGEPIMADYWHEISHCTGDNPDAPMRLQL